MECENVLQKSLTLFIFWIWAGNVRKNPKLSGTTHNVFGIQVGVSINFFIKKADNTNSQTQIFYAPTDEFWRKEDKYNHLNSKLHYQNVEWEQMTPDKRNTWLTEGLHAEFDTFIPMGNKEMKAAKGCSNGCDFQDLQSWCQYES